MCRYVELESTYGQFRENKPERRQGEPSRRKGHDVFGYFADRYEFTVLDTIIAGFSTVSEPSARHLAGLREAIAGTVRIYGSDPGGHVCIAYIKETVDLNWRFPATVDRTRAMP